MASSTLRSLAAAALAALAIIPGARAETVEEFYKKTHQPGRATPILGEFS
jgi:hypothetical protein